MDQKSIQRCRASSASSSIKYHINFILVLLLLAVAQAQGLAPGPEAKDKRHFSVSLLYNTTSQLFTLPVYLGYHPDELRRPFTCSLDLSLPSVLVPNVKCEDCWGQRYSDRASSDPSDTSPAGDVSEISHKEMYMEYTDGSYKVQSESNVMILNYDPAFGLQEQIILKEYEFYSILEDNNEQNMDSMFGLGLVPPRQAQHQDDKEQEDMNILMWLKDHQYIRKQVASIYLGVYDGTDKNPSVVENQQKYALPQPHIEFGQYTLAKIAKHDEIHFFSTTSEFNWTLDFFGMQDVGGKKFYDLDPQGNSWVDDPDRDNQHTVDGESVTKAHFNPGTPFISLPNSLFQRIAASWKASFPESQEAYCGTKMCTVFTKCSEVKDLPDFGFKLGSYYDIVKDPDETEDAEETDNVLRRGPSETIYSEWRPMYFRLPYESYLIPGTALGRSANLCYLSITGDIPDDEGIVIFGQPFFRNYYTVLDQDSMKIGLAANAGSRAAISDRPFNDSILVELILGVLGFVISLVLIFFAYQQLQRKLTAKRSASRTSSVDIHKELEEEQRRADRGRRRSLDNSNVNEDGAGVLDEEPGPRLRANSKNKYLPAAKFGEVFDDNSLLGTSPMGKVEDEKDAKHYQIN